MYTLLDDVPVPLFVLSLDAEARLLFVNGSFTRTLGGSPQEHPTLSDWLARAVSEEPARAALLAWWGAVLAQPRQGRVEAVPTALTLTDAAGARRAMRLDVTVREYDALVALVDVSESKRLDERLRLSEERHRLLAENAKDVVWTMALDGSITYVSPSVETVRGFTPEEAMRQTLDQILTPASQAVCLAYFAKLYADVQAGRTPETFRGEYEYLCKDGSTFWTDVMALPVMAADGTFAELLGVTRDLRERKAAELGLKAALAENQALVAELRQALLDVKTLNGLLPICMFCKKIRNDTGYWDRIEAYICTHTDAQFSHGLCDDCAEKHYPE